MKVLNFLAGMMFAAGFLLFLYGLANSVALNIYTGFGLTNFSSGLYREMINRFSLYLLAGGVASSIGAGLALIRK